MVTHYADYSRLGHGVVFEAGRGGHEEVGGRGRYEDDGGGEDAQKEEEMKKCFKGCRWRERGRWI